MNIYRWNCNVFGVSRKMTAGNYVRLLVSVGSAAAFGCWGRTLRPFMRSSSLRRWGFCTTRSLLAACRRRVEPSCSAIPPDWCRRQPRVSRLGPADQAARLSETPVAFAGAGRASTETVIAFAGEKWAFLERFSVAVVLLVSTVAFQGRALAICRVLRTRSRPRTLRAGPRALRSRRASRDTTEAGPRRIPPLVVCGGRAVGADKPTPETQCPSLSSVTTVAVASGTNAQFFHQPLTVSTAWAPRSVSAEWALTRPEDRRAAWKREATFSQFTTFHQALT